MPTRTVVVNGRDRDALDRTAGEIRDQTGADVVAVAAVQRSAAPPAHGAPLVAVSPQPRHSLVPSLDRKSVV